MHNLVRLDCETLLAAYAQGVFPMGRPDGSVRWYTADPRAILPLEAFRASSTLRQTVRQGRFEIRINYDFAQTMRACGQGRDEGTWINAPLVSAYIRLYQAGFAHSVEAWQEGELAGGLYGVALGGAFFGESMFHRVRDASKVALVALVARLRDRGYELLDAQATTGHLQRFGAIEVPASEYLQRLKKAITKPCAFV